MYSNRAIKIICSLPVIFIISYFIPFIGICLIITRYLVYSNRKYDSTFLILIVVGVFILIPQLIVLVLKIVNNEDTNISFLNRIIQSDIYPSMLRYSKFLIIVGIISLIISFLFKNLFYKLSEYIRAYISNREKIHREISQKNDMEIKLKQEKAKNTQVVYCPFCGADNIVTESVGNCKYCRRTISHM